RCELHYPTRPRQTPGPVSASVSADGLHSAGVHVLCMPGQGRDKHRPERKEGSTMTIKLPGRWRPKAAILAATALAAPAGPAALAAAPSQAASANLFASVSASGTLVTGNGVSSVTHIGTGQYEVTFSSNVASCAYVATTINASSQALLVFTAGGHLSADGV